MRLTTLQSTVVAGSSLIDLKLFQLLRENVCSQQILDLLSEGRLRIFEQGETVLIDHVEEGCSVLLCGERQWFAEPIPEGNHDHV